MKKRESVKLKESEQTEIKILQFMLYLHEIMEFKSNCVFLFRFSVYKYCLVKTCLHLHNKSKIHVTVQRCTYVIHPR